MAEADNPHLPPVSGRPLMNSRRIWRLLLLILLVLLALITLNLSTCKPSAERSKVQPTVQTAHSSQLHIENLTATFNRGVVTFGFDALLLPPADDAVTLDYQISTSSVAEGGIKRLVAGQVSYAPKEEHKQVHIVLTTKAKEEMTLTLIRISGSAGMGDKGVFRIVPTDVTPRQLAVKKQRQVLHRIIVTAAPSESGRVNGGGLYHRGSRAEINAIPEDGSDFINWTEGKKSVATTSKYQFRVNDNRTLIAYFRKVPSLKPGIQPALESTNTVGTTGDVVTSQTKVDSVIPSPVTNSTAMRVVPDGVRFVKLDASGNPLPGQGATYNSTTWDCVLDNTTGLIWEVKSHDAGLHDRKWTYTWYNSDASTNGGKAGKASRGQCGDTVAGGCDTEKFVEAVNNAGLCGAKDWRLPTQEELQSLTDLTHAKPSINNSFFPNTNPSWYWTASPVAADKAYAWLIGFYYGYDVWGRKDFTFHARLVRSNQSITEVPGKEVAGK